jgi:hypothetical protein
MACNNQQSLKVLCALKNHERREWKITQNHSIIYYLLTLKELPLNPNLVATKPNPSHHQTLTLAATKP